MHLAGVAGGSAHREHQRRKSNRETRVKDRFGRRLGGAILAITDEPQSTRAWATGARGEEKLAKALEGIDGLRVLHDRRVHGSRANIDHIAVAPAGVFVIDAKHYAGKIEIRNRGWFLRPDHRKMTPIRPPGRAVMTCSPWPGPVARPSVEREVVGVLVAARPLELDLHQHIVEQRRRPEPEPVR